MDHSIERHIPERAPLPSDLTKTLIPATMGLPIIAVDVREARANPDQFFRPPSSTDLPGNGADVVRSIMKNGSNVNEFPIPVYPPTSLGKYRSNDNADVIKGHENIYDSLGHFSEVYKALSSIRVDVRESLHDGDPFSSAELEDIDKITIQKWKRPGYFLHNPMASHLYRGRFDPLIVKVAQRVCSHLARKVGDYLGASTADASLKQALLDFDPPDTMVGMPTLKSGDQSIPARRLTAAALPSPLGLTPGAWFDKVDVMAASLGIPQGFLYASVMATRHKPTNKPLVSWVSTGAGYIPGAVTQSLYDDSRFVYPIPHFINLLLSSGYVSVHQGRVSVLGGDHSPDQAALYCKDLQTRKYLYTSDFSGMDTSMGPDLINLLADSCAAAGFSPWSMAFLKEYYRRTLLLLPSYSGNKWGVTSISEVISWMSGFKLTSEFDSLVALIALFSYLENRGTGELAKWEKGHFSVPVQGDDQIFSLDTPLDIDDYSDFVKKYLGMEVKAKEGDAMFLKNILPVLPSVPKRAKSLSRFIQQSFFNEDKYTGIEGGTRPDAVMRLALMVRSQYLLNNPIARRFWPRVAEVLLTSSYVKTGGDAFRRSVMNGNIKISASDQNDILNYATTNDSFYARIAERSKFENSAAILLDVLHSMGLSSDNLDDLAMKQRQVVVNALIAQPSINDVNLLVSSIPWRS